MLIPFGVLSAAGAGGVGGTYELIASEILTTSQATITFSNLGDYASTYKHLQIRSVARTDRPSEYVDPFTVRLNGDSGSNYARHQLSATDAGVISNGLANDTGMFPLGQAGGAANSNVFAGSVIDFLDAYSTTKNKTARAFTGVMGLTTGGNNSIRLVSGVRFNTSSITSITITATNSFQSGSRFSLYGIKG
jgi:hypothetical protein